MRILMPFTLRHFVGVVIANWLIFSVARGVEFIPLGRPADLPVDARLTTVDRLSPDGSTLIVRYREDDNEYYYAWNQNNYSKIPELTDVTSLRVSDNGRFIGRREGNGIVWDADNGFRDLGNLGPMGEVSPMDISNDGQVIVGDVGFPEGVNGPFGTSEAFVWTETEGMVGLGWLEPGSRFSVANAVSADGQVVIGTSSTDGNGVFGFRWTSESGMTSLGQIVENHDRPFTIGPSAVSADGNVIVGHYTSNDGARPFIWTRDSGIQNLPLVENDLDIVSGFAERISADGSLIAGSLPRLTPPGDPRVTKQYPALWFDRDTPVFLDEFLIDSGLGEELRGWSLGSGIYNVSDDGRIITGRGRSNPGGQSEPWMVILDIIGDFNGSRRLDVNDVNLLSSAIRDSTPDNSFDLNNDSVVDFSDLRVWVKDLKKTYLGDSNLDGEFNSRDLVAIFEAGEYEDDIIGNSTWATGDWNGDGDFTTSDLVVAFEDGGYEKGPRPALAAVPEPTGVVLLGIGVFGLLAAKRNRRQS